MTRKKVLICPLNWGLGHATRDVPIIRLLLKHNFNIIIAASGDSLAYLKKEFPELEFINFESYKVQYSRFESQVFKMLMLIPSILFWTIKEHLLLKEIIKNNKIGIVISDPRFGLWNKKTHNVFITHQLRIKFPGLLKIFEPVYHKISNKLIRNYEECWIPDFEGQNNLSGELSHVKDTLKNTFFIGPLSRFEYIAKENTDSKIDVLFILSGPEPQRSVFEKIICDQTKNSVLKYEIVRGTSSQSEHPFDFPVNNILNAEDLFTLIKKSEIVVCRSGYSSIMDLFQLKKKAILVPTPGQTEQEYLAGYLKQKGFFYSVSQKNFNLQKDIKQVPEFPEIKMTESLNLEERVLGLLQ
ncbi:MAG TPA: glycosyltransferase [Bacteroidales bacterium]|nr:glycosyltransferase [Bacteroidales bacterium]